MKQFSRGKLIGVLSLAVTWGSAPALAGDTNMTGTARPSVAAVSGSKVTLGTERVFRISSRGTSHVDIGLMTAGVSRAIGEARPRTESAPQLQTIRFDLSAQFHTRVVSVDPKGWTEAARLQDVVYAVDGTADARTSLLATPFLIRYDNAGRMSTFSFPRQFPAELQAVIQRMVEPLQVVTGAPGATSWSTEERESDVTYTAGYVATGALTLTKSKTQVTPTALEQSNLPLAGRPAAKINRSEALIELDPATGRVAHVTSTESVSTTWGHAFFSDYDTRYEAVRVTTPLAPLARTFPEAQAALADPAFARARLYDVDRQTFELVKGLDLVTAMQTYRATATDRTGLASRLLKNWLRLHPEKSAVVARQIDALDPKADENAFEFGWASLAAAGHLEAQQALLQVMTTPGWKPVSKEKAIVAMMSLEAPDPLLARAVWTERQALAARGAATGMQGSIVTNVYGAMGDVEKANPALTTEVVNNLAGLLSKADARSQVLALDALSNVGDLAKVVPLAAPKLVSPKPEVRVAAFSTFRRLGGNVAFEKFAVAFAGERDAEVRLSAARVALAMPQSDQRNEWARAQIGREPSAKIQSQLVLILGRGLKAYPQNAAFLEGLLETVHDRAVRRDIYAFAAPAAVKGGTP